MTKTSSEILLRPEGRGKKKQKPSYGLYLRCTFFPHHVCICEVRMKQKWCLANSPSAKCESHPLHFLVNFNHAVLYYKLDPGRPFPRHQGYIKNVQRHQGYIKNVWMHVCQFQNFTSRSGKLGKVQNMPSIPEKVCLSSNIFLDDSYPNMASLSTGRACEKYKLSSFKKLDDKV